MSFPAIVAVTEHEPVPLVAVNWFPDTVQLPVALYVTRPPVEPPVTLIVSILLYVSGDPALTESAAWFALPTVWLVVPELEAKIESPL